MDRHVGPVLQADARGEPPAMRGRSAHNGRRACTRRRRLEQELTECSGSQEPGERGRRDPAAGRRWCCGMRRSVPGDLERSCSQTDNRKRAYVNGIDARALRLRRRRRRRPPPSSCTGRSLSTATATPRSGGASAVRRRAGGRASETSRSTTAAGRSAAAIRASPRAPTRASTAARSRRDGSPCSTRTRRPCRCGLR